MYMEKGPLAKDNNFRPNKSMSEQEKDFLPEHVDQPDIGGPNKDAEDVGETDLERVWLRKKPSDSNEEAYDHSTNKVDEMAKEANLYWKNRHHYAVEADKEPYAEYSVEIDRGEEQNKGKVIEIRPGINKKQDTSNQFSRELLDWFAEGKDKKKMFTLAVAEDLREEQPDLPYKEAKAKAEAIVKDIEREAKEMKKAA